MSDGHPTSWVSCPKYMYQRIRVTSHGLVCCKMVNPGINYHFYINPKNERDCHNRPCKSTQEPCKNIIRVWIVSLVHTLGFPHATAPTLIQMGRFARSIATISIVFRVSVKLIIDPWIIDHLPDHPVGRNPNTLVHILRALHSRSGVAIRHVIRKSQSSSPFKWKEALIICILYALLYVYNNRVIYTFF